MKITKKKSLYILITLLTIGCNNNSEPSSIKEESKVTALEQEKPIILANDKTVNDTILVLEKNGITITEIPSENSPSTLSINPLKQVKTDSNVLSFNVTKNKAEKIIILQNGYKMFPNKKSIKVPTYSGDNVILCFLEKNGVSLKQQKAIDFINVNYNAKESFFKIKKPHLFITEPSVNHPFKIDYLLFNTKLGLKGNKVRITINKSVFIVSKWCAFQVDGIKATSYEIRLELIDNNATIIEGPFNDTGTRTIKL